MEKNIVGALLAFAVGVAIAAVGYALSRHTLRAHAERYTVVQLVKQAVQIVYLVALFFVGEHTPWNALWLLVGGCLGITLPMFWFTYRLVRCNDALHKKGGEDDG